MTLKKITGLFGNFSQLGHVWGIIWGMSRGIIWGVSGASLGASLGHVWGKASTGASLAHHLGMSGHVWGMSEACLEHVWDMSGASSGASSGACLGHVWGHYLGHHMRNVWGIIWGMSGACLGQHLGNIVKKGQQSAVLHASVMPFLCCNAFSYLAFLGCFVLYFSSRAWKTLHYIILCTVAKTTHYIELSVVRNPEENYKFITN